MKGCSPKCAMANIMPELCPAQFDLKVVPGGSAFGAACVAAASQAYMRSVDNGTYRPPRELADAPVRKFPARRASKN